MKGREMVAPYHADDAVLRQSIAAAINAERARRAAQACCKGAGSCGDRDCQIASAVDDALADIVELVASGVEERA